MLTADRWTSQEAKCVAGANPHPGGIEPFSKPSTSTYLGYAEQRSRVCGWGRWLGSSCRRALSDASDKNFKWRARHADLAARCCFNTKR